MKRVALIIPYFGKFKSYMELFLNSCRENPTIDWLLFTDIQLANIPRNVIVHQITFEQLKKKIACKLGFDAILDSPYKLCDYRPAYGKIFVDELVGYDYWGYCDCDLVFGNIRKYLNEILVDDYDKIFAAGHLSLYKNTELNVNRFMKPYKGKSQIERVFGNSKNTGFDEAYYGIGNIHQIYIEDRAKVFETDYSANPAVRRAQFQLMRYSSKKGTFIEMPYRKTMYVWDHGTVKGLYVEDGVLKTEEYIYMHFQNRDMRMDCTDMSYGWDCYQIVPNRFIPIQKVPETVDEWSSYELEPKNRQLQDIWRMDIKYKFNKLMQLLHLR